MSRPWRWAAFPLLIALAPGSARGTDLTEAQVRTAVETWVRSVSAYARPDAVVERIEPRRTPDGSIAAYVAHLEKGGFCIAGSDRLAPPVTFYSPSGAFDPADPNLAALVEVAERRWDAARGAAAKLEVSATARIADRAAQWDAFLSGHVPQTGRLATESVQYATPPWLALPVTCTWDQPSPYNDRCPELTPGADDHVLVGCNAIATAQIMYYWKWPDQGLGTESVVYSYRYRTTWDSQPLATAPAFPPLFDGRLRFATGQLQMNGYWDASVFKAAQSLASSLPLQDGLAYLSALDALWGRMAQAQAPQIADFGLDTFDWSLLHDVHTDPPHVAEGDLEVAKFCRDVAIACRTEFGLLSSNSFFGNDVDGLRNHLRYDPDALFTDSPNNGGAGADAASLIAEIQWGRPAGLGGMASRGGHAWVVQGYNTFVATGTQFLMNFGFGGASNGWYTLDDPFVETDHDMMTRVAPLAVKFVGASAPGDGSPSSPYQDLSEAVLEAPDGATLMLKASSIHAYATTIQRPLTLKGFDVTIH